MDEKKWEIARFVTEKLSQAIAAITSPQRVKNSIIATAEGRRHEMLLLERTEQDLKDVRLGKKRITEDAKVVDIEENSDPFSLVEENWRGDESAPLQDLMYSARESNQLNQLEEETRLRKIQIYAFDKVETGEFTRSEKEVDPNWVTKWRNRAKEASTEEIQRLWADVFVEESFAGNHRGVIQSAQSSCWLAFPRLMVS